MKKLINFLYSTRLMAILFVLFAAAMGVATFIENDFGTQTSKALVYNAWWFEAIMGLFIINFLETFLDTNSIKRKNGQHYFFTLLFCLSSLEQL